MDANELLDEYDIVEKVYKNTVLQESYWPGNTGHELFETTVPMLLRRNAKEVPDKTALVLGAEDPKERKRWTYAELLRDAEDLASALLNVFKPGDRIAVMAHNIPEYVIIEYGLSIAGLTMVTLNPAYHKREVEHILQKAEVIGVFAEEEWRGNRLRETVESLKADLPSLRKIIPIKEMKEFVAQNKKPVTFPEIKPDDPFVIMFTSGTTGLPKGARLNHRGMTNSTRFMALRAGMPKYGTWINVMPMQHMGGCGFAVLGTLQQQGTLVQVDEFNAEVFLKLVEEEKGDYALLVPTMVEAILNSPNLRKHDISTLRYIQSGAAKVEAWLARRVIDELGCKMSIVCGQTECSGGYTQTHLDDELEDQTETIGQPYPVIELKIADPVTHKVLPLNTDGEICVRGYQVMIDYYNDPQATHETIDEEGWLHSGDLASMDERGFLTFKGRLKDMIIRGGVNIYPAEVERVLMENPKIQNVAVIGVDDEYWGEQIAACIIPKSFDDLPTVDELDKMCLDNIARFKRPRYYAFLKEFPVTSTGKLRKFQLREDMNKGLIKTEKIKSSKNSNKK